MSSNIINIMITKKHCQIRLKYIESDKECQKCWDENITFLKKIGGTRHLCKTRNLQERSPAGEPGEDTKKVLPE